MNDQPVTVNKSGQINVILQKRTQREKVMIEKPALLPVIDAPEKDAVLHEIEQEMSQLIGLEEIKKTVREIYAWITINHRREEKGLKADKQVLHMMFKGNPGTGKTTMARLIGKLFVKMNVLSKGHLIEAERGDLVGEYIGHTAIKTRELLKKAQGGILFIDEAYSLGRGGEKDFGREAIDTLVKHMEDKQHEFVLILAGYSHEMNQFLKMNPGLTSRLPIVVDFPDYNDEQLMSIVEKSLTDRQYLLSKDCEYRLRCHLQEVLTQNRADFSNGRYVRNIIEKSIRLQAMRLLKQNLFDRKDLMLLRSCDLAL